jgi:ribonuclease HIII
MAPVIKLPTEKFDEFKAMLEKDGFTFEVRPYQIFLARKGAVVVNLYESGKIVFGGADKQGIERVSAQLQVMGSEEVVKQEKVLPPLEVPGNHIGTDEVGKGDYFGPLVVAGVLVTADTEKALKNLGVRDSKTLSDTTIRNLAIKIRKIVGRNNYEEVWITPLKYNIMYQRNRNVNRILGWGHAREFHSRRTDEARKQDRPASDPEGRTGHGRGCCLNPGTGYLSPRVRGNVPELSNEVSTWFNPRH